MLRDHRRHLGLTQMEVAEQVGTTQGVISRTENRKSQPRPQLAKRLAALYRITLEEVYSHSAPDGSR